VALAPIIGGAIGNLIDRLRLGYVIDYVDVFWGPHHSIIVPMESRLFTGIWNSSSPDGQPDRQDD